MEQLHVTVLPPHQASTLRYSVLAGLAVVSYVSNVPSSSSVSSLLWPGGGCELTTDNIGAGWTLANGGWWAVTSEQGWPPPLPVACTLSKIYIYGC